MRKLKLKLSRRGKWLLWLVTPCVVLGGGAAWLVASTPGLQWLSGMAVRHSGGKLSISGVEGSLLEALDIQQLVLHGEGARITLRGVHLLWQPQALLHKKLNVLQLSLQQVEVLTLPQDKPAAAPALPASISVPLEVSVAQLHVGALRLFSRENAAADFAADNIDARLDSNARQHALQLQHLSLPQGELAGALQISTLSPYALQVTAKLDAPLRLSGKTRVMHITANADGDMQHLNIKMQGEGAGMTARATAKVSPFSAVLLDELALTLNGVQAQWLSADIPPTKLSGNAKLYGRPGGVLEGALQLRNANAASYDQHALPVLGLSARMSWSDTQLQVRQLDASFPGGGHLTGNVQWHRPSGKLAAQLKVRELDPKALHAAAPATHINGDIKLESSGQNQRAVLLLGDGNFAFSGDLRKRGKQLELRELRLARGETVLVGRAQMALDRRRTFSLDSQLQKLDLSQFTKTPATDLNAELQVSGALLPEAAGVLQFDLFNSRFDEYEIGGSGHLDFVGLRRAAGEIEARLGDNSLRLDVAHGTGDDHLKLLLEAPDLAQVSAGLGGRLSGQGDLSGTLEAPALNFALGGKGLRLDGQYIDQLEASGELSDEAMNLQIGMIGYRNAGEINLPQAKFDFHGSRAQHTVHASARLSKGAAVLSDVGLVASGSFSDAAQGWRALQWRGELEKLDAGGIAPLRLLSPAPLAIEKNRVRLGAAELAMGGGTIKIDDVEWTPQRWHSAGKFGGLNVRAVNLHGDRPLADAVESMRFGGAWEMAEDAHLRGFLQLRRESGDWVIDGSTGMRLGLRTLQLSLRAEQDKLEVELDAAGDKLGEMAVRANLPLSADGGAWTISPQAPLQGHVHLLSENISWLGPMLDGNLQSGGSLKMDADLLGSLQAPRLRGEATGEALSFALLDQGVSLERGQLAVRFAPEAVYLDQLAFSAPYREPPGDSLLSDYKLTGTAGGLSAVGRLDLQGDNSDLRIDMLRMPLAQRADRWVIASGSGHARYANKTLMLGGNIRAEAGIIKQIASNRPRWSSDMKLLGEKPPAPSAISSAVDATLDLGEHFYIRASGLEARLAGKLDAHSEPGGALQVTGIIAAQDALFDAYGQRLQVERGMVNFQGPLDDPGLNILALRKGLSVEAGVQVTGTVRRPTVQLVSTPSVPDAEKLSWIMLGRVPDSTGVDSTLLLAAAGNILGGQSASQIGRAVGVDELSLHQKAGTSDAEMLQNQVVTVGKRLSARAYLSYEQGLSDSGGLTKFTYMLTPRITVVTKTGTDDALDLVYSFRFY